MRDFNLESVPRETVKRVLESCVEVLLVLELSDKMMRKTSVNEHWNRREEDGPLARLPPTVRRCRRTLCVSRWASRTWCEGVWGCACKEW